MKRRTFLGATALAVALLVLPGAGGAEPQKPLSSCRGSERYIPQGTFPVEYPGSDAARRKWYSLALERMREPALSCRGWPGAEAYRILWLSDRYPPVGIRITRYAQSYELVATQLSGLGYNDPGVILNQIHKTLTAADWSRLQAALEKNGFWAMPTSGNFYGLHGEQWIIEGGRNTAYHITDRWTPPAGAYRELGRLFFELAGWLAPAAGP